MSWTGPGGRVRPRALTPSEVARLPPEEQEKLRRQAEENKADFDRYLAGITAKGSGALEAQKLITRDQQALHQASLGAVGEALAALPELARVLSRLGSPLAPLLVGGAEDALLAERRWLSTPSGPWEPNLTQASAQGVLWCATITGLARLFARVEGLESGALEALEASRAALPGAPETATTPDPGSATEETVARLASVVGRLEARVVGLEARLQAEQAGQTGQAGPPAETLPAHDQVLEQEEGAR